MGAPLSIACDAWAWRSQWIDAAGLTPARLAASLTMKLTARSVSGLPGRRTDGSIQDGKRLRDGLRAAIGADGFGQREGGVISRSKHHNFYPAPRRIGAKKGLLDAYFAFRGYPAKS
jgi:hypothetical protein